MADSDLGHADLFDAIVAEVEGCNEALHLSDQILDPKESPQTRLDRIFSLEMQSLNSGKYRDDRGGRLRMGNEAVVRIAHRLNPKSQVATQRQAYSDEQDVIVRLMTTTRRPLCFTRIEYVRTRRALNPQREWLFTDVTFSVEFDFELPVVGSP